MADPRPARGDPSVCADEAWKWQVCATDTYSAATAKPEQQTLAGACGAERSEFDHCVAEWRRRVGDGVKLRGDHQGEPPEQCAPLSCVYQSCMQTAQWNDARCRGAMLQFKHCVKQLHGSEFVLD